VVERPVRKPEKKKNNPEKSWHPFVKGEKSSRFPAKLISVEKVGVSA
jgi:hypothetical protein